MTQVIIIPGGLTPLVQPADHSWNRSVKSKIRKYWADWKSQPKRPDQLTKSGNLKRPTYAEVAEWCLKAWDSLDTSFITKSFVKCGLGKERDDTLLHKKLLDVLTNPNDPNRQVSENEEMEIDDRTGQNEGTNSGEGFFTDDESDNEETFTTIDFNEND